MFDSPKKQAFNTWQKIRFGNSSPPPQSMLFPTRKARVGIWWSGTLRRNPLGTVAGAGLPGTTVGVTGILWVFKGDVLRIWLVVSNIFFVHPYLGKIPILTSIFFRWVETTNLVMVYAFLSWDFGFITHVSPAIWGRCFYFFMFFQRRCFVCFGGKMSLTLNFVATKLPTKPQLGPPSLRFFC